MTHASIVALVVGLALILLIRWVRMRDQSGLALLGYWFGVVLGVTALGIGAFLSLPREVATTFDLRSNRVVNHLRIGGGWYERRRTYAFAEIAGLRLIGMTLNLIPTCRSSGSGMARRGGPAPQTAMI